MTNGTVWVATATWPVEDVALLDDEERAHSVTFLADAVRRRYVGSHAFLRRVLADHLGVDPAEIRYERHCEHCAHPEHGRPRLVGGRGPSFSLSHSGPHVLVAVTDGLVGADIEEAARRPVAERVIRRTCTVGEQAWLAGVGEADRSAAFLGLWTRKEAVAKALGLGLVLPFGSFEVVGPDPITARGGAPPLVTHALDVPGAVAAVAVAPGVAVRLE